MLNDRAQTYQLPEPTEPTTQPATLPTPTRALTPEARLAQGGPKALSDEELVAVLLGGKAGRAGARKSLREAGTLRQLCGDALDPVGAHHYGAGVHAKLTAAIELGRRLQRPREDAAFVRTPEDGYRLLAPELSGLPHEVFHVVALNPRNEVLRSVRVAEGTVSQCAVDPRRIFGLAVTCRATGLVLAHNHPSGDPEPSDDDRQLTRQLVRGAELLGVRIVDHLVIGAGTYVSLAERGLMR